MMPPLKAWNDRPGKSPNTSMCHSGGWGLLFFCISRCCLLLSVLPPCFSTSSVLLSYLSTRCPQCVPHEQFAVPLQLTDHQLEGIPLVFLQSVSASAFCCSVSTLRHSQCHSTFCLNANEISILLLLPPGTEFRNVPFFPELCQCGGQGFFRCLTLLNSLRLSTFD